MHLGRGRGAAYPECITHIGTKRIGINKSCVVSHRGALRSAVTLRGLGPRFSACGSNEVAPLSILLPRRHLSNSTLNLPSNLRGCGAVQALRVSKFILFILRSRTLFPRASAFNKLHQFLPPSSIPGLATSASRTASEGGGVPLLRGSFFPSQNLSFFVNPRSARALNSQEG